MKIGATITFALLFCCVAFNHAGVADETQLAVQYVQVIRPNTSSNGNSMAAKMLGQQGNDTRSIYGEALASALQRGGPSLSNVASIASFRLAPVALGSKADAPSQGIPTTITMSAQRTRIDLLNSSTVVQCDLRQIIVMNHNAKTYSIEKFDELAPPDLVSGALAQAQSNANTAGSAPDEKTDTIMGMTAHHELQTVRANGPVSLTTSKDIWYAEVAVNDGCAPAPGHRIRVPLRIVKKLDMSSLAGSVPPAPPGAPATMPDIGDLLTTRYETTSVKQIPYDAASFAVPTGYAQVPLPPPPPQPSPPANFLP